MQNPYVGFEKQMWILKPTFTDSKVNICTVFLYRKKLIMQNPYVGFEKQIWVLKPIFTV